jgi:hypothetical protein
MGLIDRLRSLRGRKSDPATDADATEAASPSTSTSGSSGPSDQGPDDREFGAYRRYERTPLPGAADPARIVEQVLDHEPNPNPRGRAITARVTRTRAATLQGVVNELEWRFTNPSPVLVAIPHDESALRTVVEAFDTTVAVAGDREEYVEAVRTFVPFLFDPNVETGPIGSVRLIDGFDVGDAAPTQGSVFGTLRERRGRPLHGRVKNRRPDYFAFAAPGDFHDGTRGALHTRGEVLGGIASSGPEIRVAGFTFTGIDDWFGPTQSLHTSVDAGTADRAGSEDEATNAGGGADRETTSAVDTDTNTDTGVDIGRPIPSTVHHTLDWTDGTLEVHTWHDGTGTGG